MSDKQPTEVQIKKFLQWCGIQCYYKDWANDDIEAWICPPDSEKTVAFHGIDLNFLFKYAVPKVKEHIERTWVLDPVNSPYQLFLFLQQWITDIAYKESDPALALFWAIWEVINE